MTKYDIIKAEELTGNIALPASKSISNRALVINALSQSGMMPENVSDCDDTFVMIRALKGLQQRNCTEKEVGAGDLPVIDIMAAGTAMRFLTAFLSVTPGKRIITGTERMQHRPIAILVNALRTLGADISYVNEEGFPPLCINGKPLEGGSIELAGNVSSQYISAMLMIAPTLKKGLTLTLTGGIVSRPYIDMTLSIMREFGAQASFTDNVIRVEPTGYTPVPYYVENDWSAASYWYELVALTPESRVELPGLFTQSLQGDQGVKDIFEKLGVKTLFSTEDGISKVTLQHTGKQADRLDIDMLRMPDLAQTVVVTCCMLNIPFRITGLQSLKIKETDRIYALRTELKKLGYLVCEADDSILFWDGERCMPATETDEQGSHLAAIDTYEDHRMAMAFAPCCQTMNEMYINNPEVVSKSYPNYWKDLQQIGLTIKA